LQTWNATKAAKLAGYKAKSESAFGAIGHENLRKLKIKAHIEERLSVEVMGANEVLSRLAKMARAFDVADYVSQEEVYQVNKEGEEYMSGYALKVDFKKLQKDGYSPLIKRIYQTNKGVGVEWHDQMAALVHLGKHHALFTENLNIEGNVTINKGYQVVSPDDWDEEGEK